MPLRELSTEKSASKNKSTEAFIILLKKTLALLLTGVLCISALAGCSAKTEGVHLTDSEGKPVAVEKIATINGEAISLQEFCYHFLNAKIQYEQQFAQVDSGATDIWADNAELLNYVKESSLQNIQFDRVMRKYAADNGIALNAEDLKTVDTNIAESIKQLGGAAAYKKALADMFMTETLYRTMMEGQQLQSKLQAEMTKADSVLAPTDEEAKKVFDTYLHAKHILISTDGITDEAEIAKKKATAEEALGRAKAGEDFDALVAQYGEDPGMKQMPDGYYFGEGEMVEEFYQGAKALEINAVSELIKSDFGWHIIKRMPIAPDYFEANKAALKSKMTQGTVNAELQALMAATTVEKTPEYEMITANNVK